MNKQLKFRAKQSPFNSVFWIPLLALPIITLLSQRITVETPFIPLKFYQHQLDYFDHRNAVITYWDNVYSQTDGTSQSFEYSSEHKTTKRLNISAKERSYINDFFDYKFDLSIGKSKSKWILSVHPQWIQLPKVHKLSSKESNSEQMTFQLLLSWKKDLDWSNINLGKLSKITKLILDINKLQYAKTNQNIELWAKHQNDLKRLLSNPKASHLKKSLDNYLKFQRALLLLEIASRVPKQNLIDSLQIIRNFDLLDSFEIDGSNIFSLAKTGLAMELAVLIDPEKTNNYRYDLIGNLSAQARILLKSFDINKTSWNCITAIARSYQYEMQDLNIPASKKLELKSKIEKLLIPDGQQSLASKRALMHPNGADFRLQDSHYLKRIAQYLYHEPIRLDKLSSDYSSPFSEAIQTLRFNDDYYVIDTSTRDCYKMQNDKFVKVSRLPHDLAPLSQAVIQPDPVLGQPRVFIFGGFPASKVSYTSNNLIQFRRNEQLSPFEGRFYFGMSQFVSSATGLEKTLIVGGTKGAANDLARFQDVHSTVDGKNWVTLPPISWTSRHSFGLAQVNDSLIAFGGCRTYQAGECFSEIWSSDDGANFVKSGLAPWESRGGMAYSLSPHGLFMFGGANQNKVFSDLWKTSNGKDWIQIPTSTIGSVNSQLIITKDNLWILGGKTKHGRVAPTRRFKIVQKGVQFL